MVKFKTISFAQKHHWKCIHWALKYVLNLNNNEVMKGANSGSDNYTSFCSPTFLNNSSKQEYRCTPKPLEKLVSFYDIMSQIFNEDPDTTHYLKILGAILFTDALLPKWCMVVLNSRDIENQPLPHAFAINLYNVYIMDGSKRYESIETYKKEFDLHKRFDEYQVVYYMDAPSTPPTNPI